MSVGVSIIDSPMQLSSSFVLSCEAQNITGIAVGSDLTGWVDNSGLNNDLVLASNAPSLELDMQGYPNVKFENSNSEQLRSGLQYAQPTSITYCVVFSKASVGGAINWLLNRRAGSGAREALVIGLNLQIAAVTTTSPTMFTSNVFSLNTKYVLAYTRTVAGLITVYLNNVMIYQFQNTVFDFDTNPKYYGVSSSGGGSRFDGNIYQVHVCHEALNDVKIKKLIRYCAFKTGIKI